MEVFKVGHWTHELTYDLVLIWYLCLMHQVNLYVTFSTQKV